MGELSNEGEASGGGPLQQVLLHTIDGLKIVLQEPSGSRVEMWSEHENPEETQNYSSSLEGGREEGGVEGGRMEEGGGWREDGGRREGGWRKG